MKNFEKAKIAFALVIDIAAAVVAANDIWQKIKPDVMNILNPVLECCKKIVSENKDSAPVVIENR